MANIVKVEIGQMRKSIKLDRERYYVILSVDLSYVGGKNVHLLNVWDSCGATMKESSLYLERWTVPLD